MVLFIICLILFALIGAFVVVKGVLDSQPVLIGTGCVMLFCILVSILGLLFQQKILVFGF